MYYTWQIMHSRVLVSDFTYLAGSSGFLHMLTLPYCRISTWKHHT